jgi:hypothetical protein
MIYSCLCSVCHKWHSHVFPNPKNKKKYVCIDCLHKIMKDVEWEGEDG